MDEKKIGRKKAFDPKEEPVRLSIILPNKTKVALEVFTAVSALNRNEVINEAILYFLENSPLSKDTEKV